MWLNFTFWDCIGVVVLLILLFDVECLLSVVLIVYCHLLGLFLVCLVFVGLLITYFGYVFISLF